MVARAFHGGGIDAAGRRPALLDEDARPHDAVPPRRRCALRVERGLEDVVGGRTIEAVLEIVLARPDDLHRPTDGLRRLHRVGDEIGLPAPTEAAAEQRGVDGHLLERQARDLGGERLVAAGILRRHPDFAALASNVSTLPPNTGHRSIDPTCAPGTFTSIP